MDPGSPFLRLAPERRPLVVSLSPALLPVLSSTPFAHSVSAPLSLQRQARRRSLTDSVTLAPISARRILPLFHSRSIRLVVNPTGQEKPKTMTKEWQEAANERAVEQKMDPFTVRLAHFGDGSASRMPEAHFLVGIHRDLLRQATRARAMFRLS